MISTFFNLEVTTLSPEKEGITEADGEVEAVTEVHPAQLIVKDVEETTTTNPKPVENGT
jgi:hypothetical protein